MGQWMPENGGELGVRLCSQVQLHCVGRAPGPPSEPNCQTMPQPSPLEKSTRNTCAELLDAVYARGLFRDGPYSHPRSFANRSLHCSWPAIAMLEVLTS